MNDTSHPGICSILAGARTDLSVARSRGALRVLTGALIYTVTISAGKFPYKEFYTTLKIFMQPFI